MSLLQGTEALDERIRRLECAAVLTTREYFAARAPAEPQPWFQPDMEPEPSLPSRADIADEQVRKEVRDCFDAEVEPESAEAQAWMEMHAEAVAARAAWKAERSRLRYIQWPWAWADAVLGAS